METEAGSSGDGGQFRLAGRVAGQDVMVSRDMAQPFQDSAGYGAEAKR